ncbi:MAG TPA: penicillin-binding transpeptidase domain-containing protein, partial [Mobilitalea sp.]|nr:penicillin-binding transpeptidase domain-containing protein [Mobilitalea sp.]
TFKDDKDKKAYEDSYDEMYTACQKSLYTGGYRIYTSIDMNKQQLLQDSVDNTLKKFTSVNSDNIYELQGAAVSIDNDSGKVVAIVGGRSQDLVGLTLNRAYQSFRQPGSSIKPLIVYTPAFERGYNPNTIVEDKAIKDGPKNSDGRYLGKIPLHTAVEKSKNSVAWQVFKEITPVVGLNYLKEMNFSKIDLVKDNTLAAGLGGLTYGVSPVEMAAAYTTLANDGYYREPTCIVKIMDAEGHEIVKDTVQTKKIYEENADKMMVETLMGVIKDGTARGLGLTNTVSAGKTGTTNDRKDGWFVGFTPYYTTSVWVGYDIPKTLSDLQGASYPGTIWHDYMNQIHDSSMKVNFNLYDWRSTLEPPTPTVAPTVTPTITPPAQDQTSDPNTSGDSSVTGQDGTTDQQPIDTQDPTGTDGVDTTNPGGSDVAPGDNPNGSTDNGTQDNGGTDPGTSNGSDTGTDPTQPSGGQETGSQSGHGGSIVHAQQ